MVVILRKAFEAKILCYKIIYYVNEEKVLLRIILKVSFISISEAIQNSC